MQQQGARMAATPGMRLSPGSSLLVKMRERASDKLEGTRGGGGGEEASQPAQHSLVVVVVVVAAMRNKNQAQGHLGDTCSSHAQGAVRA